MDKSKLLQDMIEELEKNKAVLVEAAQATYEAATNEESKPENEYDTRGLEASYLAGAQSKRVAEIEEALSVCKQIKIRDFTSLDPVGPTALVELDSEGKKSIVFLMPKGGGIHLQQNGKSVQVVTGNSPLGEALQGLKVGDFALVEGKQDKEYEVLNIW